MSSPPYSPSSYPPTVPYRSWFARNWKWFVPSVVVVLALGFGLFLWGTLRFVNQMFRSSEPYQAAVQKVEQSPLVAKRLGQPIQIGDIASGNLSTSNTTGHARLSIPISGPLGKGRIIVIAQKFGSRWIYHLIEVRVDGDPAAIVIEGSEDAVPPQQENHVSDDNPV
jgi:cytochrome oxidase complex assembly protein 1